MEITLKRHRYYTIRNWKHSGLIYPDYDELYQTYINTMECQHCLKMFKSTRDRHLDHCHITGLFRKIVCHNCNCCDNYINYPDGYTKENQKENKNKKQRQKYTCDCGGRYTHVHKIAHLKTKKHQKYLDNNN